MKKEVKWIKTKPFKAMTKSEYTADTAFRKSAEAASRHSAAVGMDLGAGAELCFQIVCNSGSPVTEKAIFFCIVTEWTAAAVKRGGTT